MRRMITTKQQEFVEELGEKITMPNEGTIKIVDTDVTLEGLNGGSTVAGVTVSGGDPEEGGGNISLFGDTSFDMAGYYSEDSGDYLYKISITEEGIQFQVIDDNTGDYVPKLTIDNNGNIMMPDLPTSDPEVEGALWNDNGVLKISAGE